MWMTEACCRGCVPHSTSGPRLWCQMELCCRDELHWCSTWWRRSWFGPRPRHNGGYSVAAWGCSRPDVAFTNFAWWTSTAASTSFHSRIRRHHSAQARSSSLIVLLLWFRCDVDLGSHFDVVNLRLWSITCGLQLVNLVNLWICGVSSVVDDLWTSRGLVKCLDDLWTCEFCDFLYRSSCESLCVEAVNLDCSF
jgi:hypothetical protein